MGGRWGEQTRERGSASVPSRGSSSASNRAGLSQWLLRSPLDRTMRVPGHRRRAVKFASLLRVFWRRTELERSQEGTEVLQLALDMGMDSRRVVWTMGEQ